MIEYFLDLLLALTKWQSEDFSGIGLVLYHDMSKLSHYHNNLIAKNNSLPLLKLGTSSLLEYLVMISDYRHPFHDGFHFIDNTGILTHVAQFFSPPVCKWTKGVHGQGARTLCAQYGSNIDGVTLVGSISSNKNIYLFENGNLVYKNIFT